MLPIELGCHIALRSWTTLSAIPRSVMNIFINFSQILAYTIGRRVCLIGSRHICSRWHFYFASQNPWEKLISKTFSIRSKFRTKDRTLCVILPRLSKKKLLLYKFQDFHYIVISDAVESSINIVAKRVRLFKPPFRKNRYFNAEIAYGDFRRILTFFFFFFWNNLFTRWSYWEIWPLLWCYTHRSVDWTKLQFGTSIGLFYTFRVAPNAVPYIMKLFRLMQQ